MFCGFLYGCDEFGKKREKITKSTVQEPTTLATGSAPTGKQELPCGCEMLAVVAVELLKVGVCSKCGHRFPPVTDMLESRMSEQTLPASARECELASDVDLSPDTGLHASLVRTSASACTFRTSIIFSAFLFHALLVFSHQQSERLQDSTSSPFKQPACVPTCRPASYCIDVPRICFNAMKFQCNEAVK